MAEKEQPRLPTHRAYSVIRREGQDDYWLHIGLVFPHKDGSGFNFDPSGVPARRQDRRPRNHRGRCGRGRHNDPRPTRAVSGRIKLAPAITPAPLRRGFPLGIWFLCSTPTAVSRPDQRSAGRRAQPWSRLAVGHRRRRRAAVLTAASTGPASNGRRKAR